MHVRSWTGAASIRLARSLALCRREGTRNRVGIMCKWFGCYGFCCCSCRWLTLSTTLEHGTIKEIIHKHCWKHEKHFYIMRILNAFPKVRIVRDLTRRQCVREQTYMNRRFKVCPQYNRKQKCRRNSQFIAWVKIAFAIPNFIYKITITQLVALWAKDTFMF